MKWSSLFQVDCNGSIACLVMKIYTSHCGMVKFFCPTTRGVYTKILCGLGTHISEENALILPVVFRLKLGPTVLEKLSGCDYKMVNEVQIKFKKKKKSFFFFLNI